MKLSTLEKIGFGAGDMAIAIVMISVHLLLAYFYTDVYGLKAADVGMLLLVVRLFDAIIDPLVGMLTDRFVTRWGRYRHYLLVFSVPFGLSIYLLFLTPNMEYAGKLAWAYVTYSLVTITYTFISIPYISLISVITDSNEQRIAANTYRFVMTKIAMFLVSIVVPSLALTLGGDNLAFGYQLAMGLMGSLGAVLCLFCFSTVRERVSHQACHLTLKQQCNVIFKNDQWVILCLVIIVIMIGAVIRGSVSAYYVKYFLGGGESMISPFLTVGVLASLCSMICAHFLIKKINKVTIFKYSQAFACLTGALMFIFVGPDNMVTAFIFYFAAIFFFDMQLPIYWAAIADAVDYGEKKSGVRVAGIAFGGILFSQKFGMGIAGGLFGFILGYFDYQASDTLSTQALSAINLMMTLFPSFLSLLVFLLLFKYKLTDPSTFSIPDTKVEKS